MLRRTMSSAIVSSPYFSPSYLGGAIFLGADTQSNYPRPVPATVAVLTVAILSSWGPEPRVGRP